MRAIATAAILVATGACQAEKGVNDDMTGDRSDHISSEAEAAYFQIQDELFGLQMCEDAEHREAADRMRATADDFVISNFGHETAMRLEEETADHFRTVMVVQCTGEAGVTNLEAAFERLSKAAAE